MATQPSRVVATAGKAPGRGDPVAALDDSRLAGPRAPGEDAARSAKDLLGGGRIEIGRGHRAAGALVQAPRRTGVALGDFLDDPELGCGREFGAAHRAGPPQPEEAAR